jgi:hypothetical protein
MVSERFVVRRKERDVRRTGQPKFSITVARKEVSRVGRAGCTHWPGRTRGRVLDREGVVERDDIRSETVGG